MAVVKKRTLALPPRKFRNKCEMCVQRNIETCTSTHIYIDGAGGDDGGKVSSQFMCALHVIICHKYSSYT